MVEEVAHLERQRGFAYRKLNLVRTLRTAIASAESEKTAVAQGLAVVRAELCWESDSDTRIETWSHFRPVVRATFAALAPTAAGGVGQWRPLCRHPAETIVSLRLPSLDLRS